MKFYKELSNVYDDIFPQNEETLKFLCKNLKNNSSVLDLACGTGTYSIALALKGHRVDAIDLEEEMIEIAKKKGGLYANFVAGDMTEIKYEFKDKKYDLAYCIGNSIVHLKNKEKIQSFIKDVYDVLSDKGIFIVQIVNYDRIINYDVKSLPTIENKFKKVKFIRNYNYKNEERNIEFQTELIIDKNGENESFKNSVDLIPLQKEELKLMFEKAGFLDIEIYGSFLEEEYNEESFSTIIKGTKKHI
ncbi:Ubiquinone/menaquinone biosynthesis C-methylase UbiE [Clostridium sp. USBA 49]|uniref:class I SAM-dependent methyltransferase n=1 Tax=Clostridium TaxID=1485 RepID=UPI00099AEB0A|nr:MULTISPECIES: class I SAM-dependent methyltransferase [Clostridium]SKA84027.1 Ubiquinone/menaquinone biosynthesis C-methylase UbiE [Clostridium sp. USBA 49]